MKPRSEGHVVVEFDTLDFFESDHRAHQASKIVAEPVVEVGDFRAHQPARSDDAGLLVELT
jgi:hypothetical protein